MRRSTSQKFGLVWIASGYSWRLDGGLVRGLDYYRRTTFEFRSGALDSAQNALGGGGRYDGLVEDLGGTGDPGDGLRDRCRETSSPATRSPPFRPAGGVEVFVVDTTVAGRRRWRFPRNFVGVVGPSTADSADAA